MSSLELLKSIYKPYRYTINKNVTIVDSSSGKFVVKKQNKDLFTLFNYLSSRGFDHYPKIVKNYRNEENVFEFIEEDEIPGNQKLEDLAEVLSSLHNRTVYYKSVSIDNYKEIFDNIDNNIKYLSNYYESLFLNILKEEFVSPSKYLFARNYSKIKQALLFCEEELNAWYKLVENNDKQRVSVVHNNLSLEHFLANSDKSILISWDNYKIDTPIIDIVNLYQNEYLNYDFSSFLEKYLYSFNLLEDEKKLLFILISLPLYFEIEGDSELINTQIVKKNINYVFMTEKLIRPYYAENQIKE